MNDIFPKTLRVNNKTYDFVKTRTYVPVSVYGSDDSFLRIGPRETLEKEAEFHKKLISFGFPVAKIIQEGEMLDMYYYIEESMGTKHFGELLAEDFSEKKKIADENFSSLLELSKTYAAAQLKSAAQDSWAESFYEQIHVDYILEEMPEIKNETGEAIEKIFKRLQVFPCVLSHGDFNPWNLFKKGVIDIERFKPGPAGYDLLTNIFHAYMFPSEGDYESMRTYEFDQSQTNRYIKAIDEVYRLNGYGLPSEYSDEFIFCRVIFSVVRMHHRPKLQNWRNAMYMKILKTYLQGQKITPIVVSMQ